MSGVQGGSSLSTCSSKELLDDLDQQAAYLDILTGKAHKVCWQMYAGMPDG